MSTAIIYSGSVVKGAVAWGLVEEKGFVPKEI